MRGQGIDFTKDQILLRKGRRLSDRDLMLAAAMNYPPLNVHRRPKVAVLGTGDELVAPGSTPPGPGEIVYSNGFALMAMARSEGAEVIDLGIARDRVEDIAAAVRRARAWAPTFWSPAAAPRSASMTWCNGRWRPKGLRCRSGGWRCARAGR